MNRLRRRLLTQYLATAATILAVAGAGVFFILQAGHWSRLEASVRKEIEKVASQIELEPDEAEVYTNRVEANRLDPTRWTWQVLLSSGEVLAASPGYAHHGNLPEITAKPMLNKLVLQRIYSGSSITLAARLLTVKQREVKKHEEITMPPEMVFDVRVVADASWIRDSGRSVLFSLAAVYPLTLICVALLGSWMIRRTLAPVYESVERERQFTGTASHELRTPLTAMRGEIELALRKPRPAEAYREALQSLAPLVVRMDRTVESLLILARAESGQLLVGGTPLKLDALSEGIRQRLVQLPGNQRVAVETTGDLPLGFRADATLLSQAVRNLVENATLYAPEGPIKVMVEATKTALSLSVVDAGPGFPEHMLGHKLSKRTVPGRFGLLLAQNVATAHGGSLSLLNDRVGAIARIEIPYTDG